MHAEFFVPPAHHPLHPHLLAIFRLRSATPYRETILPKGNVDLLFNLGDPLRVQGPLLGVSEVRSADVRMAGLQTQALVVRPTGGADLLGVSLRAETCAALLPLPLDELTDRNVEGPLAWPGLRELTQRLGDAATFREQCGLLLGWLAARLRPDPTGDAVQHACALLRTPGPGEPVRRAANAMAVSPRHLRRLFARHVGVSPQQYVRLTRFVDALHLSADPGRTLTQVAHAARYHDQAHFCRDFRAFAGMTPQEYRAGAGRVVGHLFAIG